jgi:hypothetical protein
MQMLHLCVCLPPYGEGREGAGDVPGVVEVPCADTVIFRFVSGFVLLLLLPLTVCPLLLLRCFLNTGCTLRDCVPLTNACCVCSTV